MKHSQEFPSRKRRRTITMTDSRIREKYGARVEFHVRPVRLRLGQPDVASFLAYFIFHGGAALHVFPPLPLSRRCQPKIRDIRSARLSMHGERKIHGSFPRRAIKRRFPLENINLFAADRANITWSASNGNGKGQRGEVGTDMRASLMGVLRIQGE